MSRYKVSKLAPQKRRWHKRHRRWRRVALVASGLLLLATLALTIEQARRAGAVSAEAAATPKVNSDAVKGDARKPTDDARANSSAVPDPSARNGADERLLVD